MAIVNAPFLWAYDVKKYYIFHHNPDNTDSQMKKIEKKSKLMGKNIIVAKEGMCVKI